MNLIIVESPTKAKTIQKFVGKGFSVKSSFGHVRDLPKSKLGVDVEKNFKPSYIIPTKARKKVSELKKTASKAESIIMATDEDREGEAISWHIAHILDIKPDQSKRITFHEITKSAIEHALKSPRKINMDLVDAQQARRILDRLVGYELSPFLWKKVARGLSAGRVQSVAVRLIVEKEREIEKFQPREYWSIEAFFKKLAGDPSEFKALLAKKDGQSLDKLEIKSEQEAKSILADLENSQYKVEGVEKKEQLRNAPPPFITSSLQQTASQRLKFSAKQTMAIAQQLYEGVELGEDGSIGLITYMRTDSLNLSTQALAMAKEYIIEHFSENYSKTRNFKTKSKLAQEAHEAIRPTDPRYEPDKIKNYLTLHQYKLYNLIWRRFLASQMKEAIFDTMAVDIGAEGKKHPYIFKANGSRIKFDGWTKIYPIKSEEVILPELKKDEGLGLIKLDRVQHFTQPPARYSEATLIKALEKEGIGRPSTYAPTISTVQDRNYVQKNEQKRFQPTEIGIIVNDLLVEHFPQIVDIRFTAKMEEELDEIAEGKMKWTDALKEFYEPFKENLEKKKDEVVKKKPAAEPTDKICPECGAPIVIKFGRFGKFYACSRFPDCRHTEAISQKTGVVCPECQKGELVQRRTKKRRVFYGCSRYPDCQYATWNNPIKINNK